jgi:hypothetical protein
VSRQLLRYHDRTLISRRPRPTLTPWKLVDGDCAKESGQDGSFVDLAQGYGSTPLGEKVGYIVGAVVILVVIVWGAAALIRNIRRR